MFLRKKVRGNRLYWIIVENVRENGKVKQNTILYLGDTSAALNTIKNNPEYMKFYEQLQNHLQVMSGEKQSKLACRPIELKDANKFIDHKHRHHKPVRGHRFSISAIDETGNLRGVATVGRPVARGFNKIEVVEVNRLASDGCDNVCSFLYGAAARIARDMGYRKIITYILESESGISLKAAGWERMYKTKGGSWDCESRPRKDSHPTEPKILYQKILK